MISGEQQNNSRLCCAEDDSRTERADQNVSAFRICRRRKSQLHYIEKHKSTGTNQKCSGLMEIGRQRRTIGTHLDSSGFPYHFIYTVYLRLLTKQCSCLCFFFIKLNFSWLYNESPVKDTIVTNDRLGFKF